MSVYSFFGIPSKERDQKLELEKSVKTEDGSRSCTQRQRHGRLQNHRRSSRTIFRLGKRDFMVLEKGKNAYSTLDSQAVSDPSTKRAQRCLTWLIGREAVCSTWYGRHTICTSLGAAISKPETATRHGAAGRVSPSEGMLISHHTHALHTHTLTQRTHRHARWAPWIAFAAAPGIVGCAR